MNGRSGSVLELSWCITRIAQAQGVVLDPVRLTLALQSIDGGQAAIEDLPRLGKMLEFKAVTPLRDPNPVRMPFIACVDGQGWGVVSDLMPSGAWVFERSTGVSEVSTEKLVGCAAVLVVRNDESRSAESFLGLVKRQFANYRGTLLEASAASVLIGLVALATSMFSMQVYDRVIPTRSEKTLLVLSAGVILFILFEIALKYARSHIMDSVVVGMDGRLSKEIFQRLLSVRIDQLPGSVGSLASQLRGYEQVRSFYTASTLFALVDLPIGLLILCVIAMVGGFIVALVPLLFACLAIVLGLRARKRINQLAADGAQMSNLKTGLIVETIEGIETIKAGFGDWKFMSRWASVNGRTIQNDLSMKSTTEGLGYISAAIQQLSYAGLVVAGAYAVMQGHLTMGGIIACSILSGRALTPVLAIPGLMVQHAHAKAAIQGLEKLYALEMDNSKVARPLAPHKIRGHIVIEQAKFAYGEGPVAIQIDKLQIHPGERIGVLGPIGSGKSTFLRLLSGLYKPQEGRVLIDGLDLAQVSRHALSRHIGYLQQDHRLFQGTLRENLLIGLPDPGDDAIHAALQRSGLIRLVSAHPKGLELPIFEGGRGLSGGQRQLVAFTRLLLCSPSILLLDEPTASMDSEQERQCLEVLAGEVSQGKTLVVVTHKPTVMPLVDRLLVVVGKQIVLDGPRDEVMARLRGNEERPAHLQAVVRTTNATA